MINTGLTFTAESKPACLDYLKLIYNNKIYSIEDFSEQYKTNEFSLDILLQKCIIVYRENQMSYSEYIKNLKLFVDTLLFSTTGQEITCYDGVFILNNNNDYYKAFNFLEKAEECLQTARYYLLRAYKKLEIDYNLNWDSGYISQFGCRCTDFTTSVLWYNSCFDYILQIIFFAFRMYEKIDEYDMSLSLEKILKLCSYNNLSNIYGKYKKNSDFKSLWKILSSAYNKLTSINEWANYIKHKGGIDFVGLKPPPIMQIVCYNSDKEIVSSTDEVSFIKLDLDDSINILVEAHKELHKCIDAIANFIDFKSAAWRMKVNGEIKIKSKVDYLKNIFS